MSRRASLLAKEQKSRPKVRFPDELVFLDNIKEGDVPALQNMLRRVSVSIDINAIGSSGMTPLHNAVMEENTQAVRLLTRHGCNINKRDIDSWTPLHAACANGFSDVVKTLLEAGADPNILTEDGERPYDLIEPHDLDTVGIMLSFRAMREGFNEEDEDEEEESENEDDDRESASVENEEENEGENEEESEEANEADECDAETEEQEQDENSENESFDEDSLEDAEIKQLDIDGAKAYARHKANKDNEESEADERDIDRSEKLHSPLPLNANFTIKSILKHSPNYQKSITFES